ncbi:MAG TPA: trypsin-like peptidase domain-containing protein [Phenylobacterium sp.]|nr:trypsin-like peptidase domain-containing protein [Phenylobacterium sp.]
MKGFRVGAVCVALLSASYAWAAPPEGYLGRSLDLPGGGKVSGPAPAALARAPGGRSTGHARAYARALEGLQPQAVSATRGAKETKVYQAASPSVVLVITKDALGSGVIVSADGKIVTNLHVVGSESVVGVIFKPAVEGASADDADVHRAKVLRRDEVADLALLQVSEMPAHVKPLPIGSAAEVQVGSDVHAIGHPTGKAWTYTRGIVSQIRRDYQWENEDRLKHQATVIQTQTPINPGNSGGPLISDNMDLIGINSFKSEGENLNFAISADDVKTFLARTTDRLTEHPKPVDRKNCKLKALSEKRVEDPKGKAVAIDEDCDGRADYIAIFPDNRREPVEMLYDDDGDGKIDAILFDKDWDGMPEYGLYDTNGDGRLDMEGRFHKGESEPYRYDRIKETDRP